VALPELTRSRPRSVGGRWPIHHLRWHGWVGLIATCR